MDKILEKVFLIIYIIIYKIDRSFYLSIVGFSLEIHLS